MLGPSSFLSEDLELNGYVKKEFKDASVQTDITSEFFMQPISDIESDNNIYSETEAEEDCVVDNEIDTSFQPGNEES